jgi:hypothetical protein
MDLSDKSSISAWLGLEFLNITFSIQEDEPEVDIEEIRDLLSGRPSLLNPP